MGNLFEIPPGKQPGKEFFEALLTGKVRQGGSGAFSELNSGRDSGSSSGLLVERIISQGETTPEGEWYDQERDEWVAVLEGEARLAFEDGSERALKRGEHAFLPKRLKHRVTYTSSPCIWLAVHGDHLTFHG